MTDRNITTCHVFPEDWGTQGLTEPGGDWNAAGNFASVFEAIGLTDFVANGMAVTLDGVNNNIDITAGKCVMTAPSTTVKNPGPTTTTETRDDGVAFVAEPEAENDIGIVDNAVNHVYLDVDLAGTGGNTATFRTGTADPPATLTTPPYLKIATVDATANTVSPVNRAPPVTAESLTVGSVGPVTATVGDTGQFIPLETFPMTQDRAVTTTSLTYTPVAGPGDRISGVNLNKYGITGLDEFHVEFSAEIVNSDALQTTYVRLQNYPSTELSRTGGGSVRQYSPRVSLGTGTKSFSWEIMVTGGTGTLQSAWVTIYGKVR